MNNVEQENVEKKKKGKGCLVAIVIFLLLGAVGSCLGDNSETNSSSLSDDNSVIETVATEASVIETENSTNSVEDVPKHRDGMVGISNKSLEEDSVDVTFSNSVLNDVTGNWRLARIAATIDITEYAVDYYNTYFENDDEVHVIVNFSTNTTTFITYMFGQLSVTIHEYVDDEEHDASVLGSGMVLGEYFVYLDNGDIENLGITVSDTEPEETENSASGKELTLGMQNALKKAESYLSVTAFSYNGLIEQLEYNGFTHEEAVFGADYCIADWNEQALKKAESYLNTTAFSYQGLIEQLEHEGFTSEEATYGVDNCSADWNEQAAKKAKSYLEFSAFSRQDLLDQLIFEGFTAEQAEYGVTEAGY